MEECVGFSATPAADWPADESNVIILGYNLVESGNNLYLQAVKGGSGGENHTTFSNNTWETWTIRP